jgi:hypothetical protein
MMFALNNLYYIDQNDDLEIHVTPMSVNRDIESNSIDNSKNT